MRLFSPNSAWAASVKKGRHAVRTLARKGRWRLNPAKKFTRRRFLLGSVALVAALGAIDLARPLPVARRPHSRRRPGMPKRLLNGVWDFQPASLPLGSQPPPGRWQSIRVPSEWNMTEAPNFTTSWGAYDIWNTPAAWDQAEAGWYQTRFTIDHLPNGRLVLLFEAVNFSATVYVNGHRAGSHTGGTLPFSVDITPFAHLGENLIWVAVTGPKAIRTANGFPYPMGSWWGQLCGGIWQDVWLLEEDTVTVSDLTVQTSTRQRSLAVTAAVQNLGNQPESVHVAIEVWDGAQVVVRHDLQLVAEPGKVAEIHWHRPWEQAVWWSPEQPHLYELSVTVRSPSRVYDSAALRFGFREVWTDRDQLIVNGQPLHLYGDEWHYFGSLENSRAYAETWYRMSQAAHANYIRLHAMPYPPIFYDVADEIGIYLVAESAIYGSSKNLDLADPAFWVHAKEHLVGRVRRDRHHPSIILWSAENEVILANGRQWAPLVASLKEPIAAHDPTRPIYFEGDGDPEGVADLISWHYPLEITQAPALPDSFYAFAPGGEQATRWKRNKPLMISEFGLMWEAGPSLLSVVTGNAPFYGLEGLWEANALITQAQIEGFRAAGVTGVSPWNLVWYGNHPLPPQTIALPPRALDTPGPKPRRVGELAATLNPGWSRTLPRFEPNALHQAIARSYRRVAALDRSWTTQAFAAAPHRRPLTVYNDSHQAVRLTLHAQWTSPSGAHASWSTSLALSSLSQQPVTINLAMPQVEQVTPGDLTITVNTADGEVVDRRQRPLTVYPRIASSHASLAVIDPVGRTSRVLQNQGYRPTAWNGEALEVPIVVAEGLAPQSGTWSQILRAASRGAKVIVLAQPPGWAAADPLRVGHTAMTRTFVQAPQQPLLDGWDSDALSWWHEPGEIAAHGLLHVPADPHYLALADGDQGLTGASLVEQIVGAGRIWFCQYPVIAQIDQTPAAERLLDRLVVQAQTALKPPLTLYYWGSALRPYFGGAPSDGTIPIGVGLLVLDLSEARVAQMAFQKATALRLWNAHGGRLWIRGGAAAAPTVSALTGVRVKSVDLPDGHRHGGLLTSHRRFTPGINNAVLDWTDPVGQPPLALHGWESVPGPGRLIVSTAVDWSLYRRPEQIKTASVLKSARSTNTALFWHHQTIFVDELLWNQPGAKSEDLRARLWAALSRP